MMNAHMVPLLTLSVVSSSVGIDFAMASRKIDNRLKYMLPLRRFVMMRALNIKSNKIRKRKS